jgi:TetR/AcrR family transcriptional regulator of autoinduction and epiphytic fitness
MNKLSLRERQAQLREDLILETVNGLLAEKGYDLMTIDEVAATVGIAKPSLYKLYDSKETLAAAAMVRLLEHLLEAAQAISQELGPAARLRALLRWALELRLRGGLPLLPSTRSTLREALMRHKPYMKLLMQVTDLVGGWITDAQAQGELNPELPPEVLLYTVFARSCDPVPDYLRLGGAYSDAQIVEMMLVTAFDGLGGRVPARAAQRKTVAGRKAA